MLHEQDRSPRGINALRHSFNALSFFIHEVIAPNKGKEAILRVGNTIPEERRPNLGHKADIG
jgi:hypothetical protein